MNTKLARQEARSARTAHQPEFFDCEERGEILIRKFRPDGQDERQMRDLVFNNAFLGKPFDEIFPGKQWFCDVVLTPYIEQIGRASCRERV